MQTKRRRPNSSDTEFKPFITSDNNHEYKKVGKTWTKTMKGLDVKLKKDKNGNPIAWFIRPNDNNVLAKLFNTRKKGIIISHARFCKKFMNEDSLLGKRYPHLISKVNAKNITCRRDPDGARRDSTFKVARRDSTFKVARAASPTFKPVSNRNPVIEPEYDVLPLPDTMTDPIDNNKLFIKNPLIDKNKPLIDKNKLFIKNPLIDKPLIDKNKPLIDKNKPLIDKNMINPNISLVPNLGPNLGPNRTYEPTFSHLTSMPPMPEMFVPKSYLLQPQSQPAVQRFKTQPRNKYSQNDLNQLIAMGFDKTHAINALMRYNDFNTALNLLTDPNNVVTQQDRQGNAFATQIQLYKQPETRHFNVVNNGGSGDCLFLSLAETLMRAKKINYNTDLRKTAFDLRQQIVSYVMSHLDNYFIEDIMQTFRDAVQGGVVVNGQTLYMHNYEHVMRNISTFGTELEISAATQIYKINIYVVNTNGIGWDQLYIGDINNKVTWANVWYIFNMNNGHYTSLVCTDSSGKCPK